MCVYGKRETILFHKGGLGDRMAIPHKDMVCVCVCVRAYVCVYGKRENHPVPQGEGGRRVLLPPWPAHTVGKPRHRRRDILFHKGGGENTP